MSPSHARPRLEPETVTGSGPQYVYVYYFERDRAGERWPCKVGRASKDWRARIVNHQASMQEAPVVGLLIRCKHCSEVEARLHVLLHSRRLSTFGREWFETSPGEVRQLTNTELPRSAFDIHTQIRLLRLDLGLTQAEVARLAGIRQATVSKVERGEGAVSLPIVQAVVHALGAHLTLD